VAVTPDGRRAVSASWDNTLKVWDLETGSLLVTFTCDAPVYCAAFADDRTIVAGDAAGRLHFLLLEERTPAETPTAIG
jgi:WD40 repeat protein